VKTRKAMIKRPFVVVSRIVETLDRDYEYRMYVHASDFAEYVADLVRAIDYEKFKPVSLKRGRGGESLHNLYNRIWGVVATHYDSPILGRYARASRRSSRKDFE